MNTPPWTSGSSALQPQAPSQIGTSIRSERIQLRVVQPSAPNPTAKVIPFPKAARPTPTARPVRAVGSGAVSATAAVSVAAVGGAGVASLILGPGAARTPQPVRGQVSQRVLVDGEGPLFPRTGDSPPDLSDGIESILYPAAPTTADVAEYIETRRKPNPATALGVGTSQDLSQSPATAAAPVAAAARRRRKGNSCDVDALGLPAVGNCPHPDCADVRGNRCGGRAASQRGKTPGYSPFSRWLAAKNEAVRREFGGDFNNRSRLLSL